MPKTYDQGCFKRNDSLAREAAKLAFKNFDIIENPNQYGVDLFVCEKGNERVVAYVECERAETYWGYEGPFKGHKSEKGDLVVRFPSRKARFLDGKDAAPKGKEHPPLKYGDLPVFFLIVNSLNTDVLIVDSVTLFQNYWKEDDKTRYGQEGDYFMCLPIKMARQKSIKSMCRECRSKRIED